MQTSWVAKGLPLRDPLKGSIGFWGLGVVISRVVSPLIWVLNVLTLLKAPLIATQEPPSTAFNLKSLENLKP